MRRVLLCNTLAAALLSLAPLQAQTVFPQQTGWSYTFSRGKGSYTSQTARVRAGARVPEVTVVPGTEVLIGKDGNYVYRIDDPAVPFGSTYNNAITQEKEETDSNGILLNSDFGFSVFKY